MSLQVSNRNLPFLILASASPRRKDLIGQLGVEFEVIPGDSEELVHDQLTARELALINAYRKARSVAKRFPDALVMGADTLVSLERTVMGKPADLGEAERMLEKLQGKTHQVVTGICLIHLRRHRHRMLAEITDVTFRTLTREQIRNYLATTHPLDKAGAYAIQENTGMIVKEISGSFSNVVGLPLERLRTELEAWSGGPGAP
jgi:septum formation protein